MHQLLQSVKDGMTNTEIIEQTPSMAFRIREIDVLRQTLLAEKYGVTDTAAVNRLLSEWKSQGVHTVEDARHAAQEHSDRAPRRPSSSKNFDERNYTDDEIRSAMVSIDDLEDEDL